MFGHELVEPAIAPSLRDGSVVVLLGVDLAEHVLEDNLWLLSKASGTYSIDSIAIFSLLAMRGSECETVLISFLNLRMRSRFSYFSRSLLTFLAFTFSIV